MVLFANIIRDEAPSFIPFSRYYLSRPSEEYVEESDGDQFDCFAILRVLYSLLKHVSVLTRLSALRWIEILVAVRPHKVFLQAEELIPRILELLTDSATEVYSGSLFMLIVFEVK